jgi:HlyD family secretion protein
MSKDLKPKQRLGQNAGRKGKLILWTITTLACGGGLFAAYHYGSSTTKVEVQVTKVRSADFTISVRSRGEVRSVRSDIVTAPQVPDLRIVKLAESGRPIKKGEVIVEFDAAQQEQTYLEKNTGVRTADSEITQAKAEQRITNELDAMTLMSSEYNVQRAKLEASKAEVLSAIEGAKNQVDVDVSEGDLNQARIAIRSHKISEGADLERLQEKKNKTIRDADRARSYLDQMVLRAPHDGIVSLLPNFRSSGSFGSTPPPFKEGDRVWTGAAIAEIPDLSKMRLELKLEEVERGKVRLGQAAKIRVDAIPEREFTAKLDWISPIAAVAFKGMGLTEKTFPAYATLRTSDARLRPGMTGSAEIVIENLGSQLLIPIRASVTQDGKPAVYLQRGTEFVLRPIEVGKRNETDIVVLKGLELGDVVALENPADAARRARKLQ